VSVIHSPLHKIWSLHWNEGGWTGEQLWDRFVEVYSVKSVKAGSQMPYITHSLQSDGLLHYDKKLWKWCINESNNAICTQWTI